MEVMNGPAGNDKWISKVRDGLYVIYCIASALPGASEVANSGIIMGPTLHLRPGAQQERLISQSIPKHFCPTFEPLGPQP